MQSQKINYIDQFRSYLGKILIIDCLGCGSYHLQKLGLCRRCEEQVLQKYISNLAVDEYVDAIQVKSLFNWIPGDSHTLSAYAYLMKSPLSQDLWRKQAQQFITTKLIQPSSRFIFVPIPSSKKRRHSEFFAKSFAQILGGSVMPLLVVNQSNNHKEQKRKNRYQRTQIQFQMNEVFTTLDLTESIVILVDDIITTGSSCRNAYEALKPLKVVAENTQLWTLFRRLKSPAECKISSC